jgi:hypothetical protein
MNSSGPVPNQATMHTKLLFTMICLIPFLGGGTMDRTTVGPHVDLKSCKVPPPPPVPSPFAPPNNFVMSYNANYQWLVNGAVNPTLVLTRGQSYTFNLTTITDEHPFAINTTFTNPFGPYLVAPTYGQVVTFTPTMNMPSTIYYHCTIHYGVMTGVIQLVTPPPCFADLNADLAVNVNDYGIFVNAFGTTCSSCPSDLNTDGLVNSTDYGLFVNAFGNPCN